MFRRGFFKRWIQQNHDGLPQKAGMPQEHLNEIHGAWFDPSNPTVRMDQELRKDLWADVVHWSENTDLCLCIGTSLCGMEADTVSHTPAVKFKERGVGFGSVFFSIQKTGYDSISSLKV